MTVTVAAAEQEFRLDSAGVRVGVPGSRSSGDFHQAEAFVDWDLPWRWTFCSNWYLQPLLDASVGWLGETGFNAAIFSSGPLLTLGHERFPVQLEGGLSPTLLTRPEFETKDLGFPLQFTSHVGVFWDALPHVRLGYRFQHMSNAGLGPHNPGLNLHAFTVSYRF